MDAHNLRRLSRVHRPDLVLRAQHLAADNEIVLSPELRMYEPQSFAHTACILIAAEVGRRAVAELALRRTQRYRGDSVNSSCHWRPSGRSQAAEMPQTL